MSLASCGLLTYLRVTYMESRHTLNTLISIPNTSVECPTYQFVLIIYTRKIVHTCIQLICFSYPTISTAQLSDYKKIVQHTCILKFISQTYMLLRVKLLSMLNFFSLNMFCISQSVHTL